MKSTKNSNKGTNLLLGIIALLLAVIAFKPSGPLLPEAQADELLLPTKRPEYRVRKIRRIDEDKLERVLERCTREGWHLEQAIITHEEGGESDDFYLILYR